MPQPKKSSQTQDHDAADIGDIEELLDEARDQDAQDSADIPSDQS